MASKDSKDSKAPAAAAAAAPAAPAAAASGVVQLTEKQKKYDRQMRLWGPHGQQRLEESHIVVLHAGPTATETLKNLVLPNVGEFTIVDGEKVTEADLGNNWFVDDSYLGQSRALAVKELLLEMNPEVKGNHLVQDPQDLINKNINYFASFQLVVACQLPEAATRKLGAFLYPKGIPLLIIRSYGLMGYMRSVYQEQTVVESHPSNDRSDIYVHPEQIKHWPALAKYCESFDLSAKVDTRTHSHTPFIAILHQHAQKWLGAHAGKVPQDNKEKEAFRAGLNAARRVDPMYPALTQENFNEAVQHAHRIWDLPELDSKVQAVLDDDKAKNITAASSNYWVLIAALNAWRAKEGHGLLMPVSTTIPDMHSFPQFYVALKTIFAEKAAQDLKEITAHVRAIQKKAGKDEKGITAAEIELFVKQCRTLCVVRTRSLEQEYTPATFNTDDTNETLTDYVHLTDDEKKEGVLKGPLNLAWYFALRGVDAFYNKHKRYPGVWAEGAKEDLDGDIKELHVLTAKELKDNKVNAQVDDAVVKEMVRYGASEMHTIAAFMGGMGAQEGLKLLIGQYVPNNNTVMYNAVHSSVSQYKM